MNRQISFIGMIWILFFALLLFAPVACGEDEDLPNDQTESSQSRAEDPGSSSSRPGQTGGNWFDAKVRDLLYLEQAEALAEPERLGLAQTNFQGDDYTVIQRYRASPEYNEVLALDPSTDVIWPGAVLKGSSVLAGDCVPLVGERAPLVFSVSLENIHGDRFASVAQPKLSSVRQALGDLLAQNLTGATPARVSFSVETVHDANQLDLAIGASLGFGGNQIKAQFDFSDSSTRSRVLVRFIQVYYSVDIDLPQRPSEFFATQAALSQVAEDLGPVAPLYVSSISYGRMAFFSFESDVDSETLQAAVSASCRSVSVEGEVSLANKSILSNARINATIIGGNGATAVNAVRGYDGLRLHLLAGGNYDKNSPAAPVMYKLRYLSDNSIGRIVLSSEYEVKNVYRLRDWYQISKAGLICDAEDDPGDEAEFFGWCSVSMYTNGMPVQGYDGGIPAESRIWDIPASSADDWSLAPGASKDFLRGIRFCVHGADRDKAVLRISAWLGEEDTIGYDDLGTRQIEIPFNEIPTERFWLPEFVHGGTRARMYFEFERTTGQ